MSVIVGLHVCMSMCDYMRSSALLIINFNFPKYSILFAVLQRNVQVTISKLLTDDYFLFASF